MKKNYVTLLMIGLAMSTSLLGCSGDEEEVMGTGGALGTGGAVGTGGGDATTGGGTATGGGTGTGGGIATGGTDAGTGGVDAGTGGDGTGGEDATTADFKVATISEALGNVITNEAGFALYTFASDTKGGEGTGVNATWPAVKVASPPSVGAGLDAADFGVTPLGQSTYDGWPLYTFAGDTAPGEVNGDSATWPVAKPLP